MDEHDDNQATRIILLKPSLAMVRLIEMGEEHSLKLLLEVEEKHPQSTTLLRGCIQARCMQYEHSPITFFRTLWEFEKAFRFQELHRAWNAYTTLKNIWEQLEKNLMTSS